MFQIIVRDDGTTVTKMTAKTQKALLHTVKFLKAAKEHATRGHMVLAYSLERILEDAGVTLESPITEEQLLADPAVRSLSKRPAKAEDIWPGAAPCCGNNGTTTFIMQDDDVEEAASA